MGKYLFLVMVLFAALFCVSDLQAARPDKEGPDVIKLKMGDKTLEFSHLKHKQLTKNQCWECHDKNDWHIEGWNKTTAHKLCIPCHDLNQKGPVSCKSCHKK